MSSEYKVGGVSSLLNKGTDSSSAELPFSSLFTVKERQVSPPRLIQNAESKEKSRKKRKLPKVSEDTDEVESNFTPVKVSKLHEETKKRIINTEEDARTIFIGNLSTETTKKEVLKLTKKFGVVQSVRFRGVSRPDMKLTKKTAVITKNVNEKRSNWIAYAKFENREDALKCCELNGTEYKNKILRVDLADNKSKDQSKALFVGNLDFTTEEDELRSYFENCGTILDVRLIRDSLTGLGNGFGYINFNSSDSVQKALELNSSVFKGRSIRVQRSKDKPKKVVKMVPKDKNSTRKPQYLKVKKEKADSFVGTQFDKEDKINKKRKSKSEIKKKSLAGKLLREKKIIKE